MRLDQQVLILRGARQVGKTSFINRLLDEIEAESSGTAVLRVNLLYPTSFHITGKDFFGRDFVGRSPTGETFLKNIEREIDAHEGNIIVFVDEVDQWPLIMESIQSLASFSDRIKFIFTGSNLENITVKNAATGRKAYVDLYPITFKEFLIAAADEKLQRYFLELSLADANSDVAQSVVYHDRLVELHEIYLRLGGMPAILSAYLESAESRRAIPHIVSDLTSSIEDNIKTVLGAKSTLYDYHDVLRTLARYSMNTLKYRHLQVDHAGRNEAKRLVHKTVGARVAHKIRLSSSESDLSKYILFDSGIVNYLLCGSHLLENNLSDTTLGIIHETSLGCALISALSSRDDIGYWKSGNQAEVEFILRSPQCIGIDIKANKGNNRSLNSMALLEPGLSCLVKVRSGLIGWYPNHLAKLARVTKTRTIPLLGIPHYLASRIPELILGI